MQKYKHNYNYVDLNINYFFANMISMDKPFGELVALTQCSALHQVRADINNYDRNNYYNIIINYYYIGYIIITIILLL